MARFPTARVRIRRKRTIRGSDQDQTGMGSVSCCLSGDPVSLVWTAAAPHEAVGLLFAGNRMISSESPVREVRTLGAMNWERKRGQDGDSDDLASMSGRGFGFAIGPCETRISG